MKKLLTGIALGAAVIVSQTAVALAGTASVSMTAPAAVTNGNSVTVSFYATASSVTTIKYTVSYDSSKLACDAGGWGGSSVLENSASAACGNGAATVTRYISGGDQPVDLNGTFVTSLTFSTIASGSASVSITSASIPPAPNQWDGVTSSRAITVNDAPAPTQSGTSPTGSGTANGNNGSNNTKSSNTTTKNTSSSNSSASNGNVSSANTSSASSAVKGATTTKKSNDKTATTPKSKSSHTGLIVSWVLGLLLAALAVGYIFMARKAKPAETPASDVKAVAAKKVSATKQTAAKIPVKKA